jgi:uncharacterized membrane protein
MTMLIRLWALLRQHVFVRLTLAHLAAALLIGAGAFANYRYGLSLGSNELEKFIAGNASIGADLFNAIGLLLVAWAFSTGRWVQGLAGTFVLVLTFLYALNAGLGFAASTRDEMIAVRQHASNEAKKVEALSVSRPSASIQADMDGILLDPRAGGCKEINGKYTRQHCPRYFKLKEELGRAQQFESLAGKTDQSFVGEADPLGANLVYFLDRLGYATKAEDIRPWQSLLFVLLVVFGGPIALWMAESRIQTVPTPTEPPKTEKKAPTFEPQTQIEAPEGNDPGELPARPERSKRPSRVAGSKVIRLTPAATQTLNALIKEGGEIRASSQNHMAKILDVSRTTLRRAIESLEGAGQIQVDNDNGFRLAVAS